MGSEPYGGVCLKLSRYLVVHSEKKPSTLKDERRNIGGEENCSKADESSVDNCISIEERAPIVIDRWFDAQVKRLYGEVVSEELPDDLSRLITELKKSF